MSSESPQNDARDEQYTVLVVEDEATHQMLVRKALVREGSPFSLVQFTRDADEAVRFALQMSFDVLLVDNRIPGRRGLDLLTELREAGVVAPFVLMTSAGSEDLVVEAYRQKVDDYVIKDSGFWKDLSQVLLRVVRADRAKRREQELHERLERTNAKLAGLHAETRLKTEAIRGLVARLRASLTQGDPSACAALVDEIEALL